MESIKDVSSKEWIKSHPKTSIIIFTASSVLLSLFVVGMIGTFSHHGPSFTNMTHQSWQVYVVSTAIFIGANLLFIFIHSRYSSPKIAPQPPLTLPPKETTSKIPYEEEPASDELIESAAQAAAQIALRAHKATSRTSQDLTKNPVGAK